jgi:hypothetical protein
VKQRFFIYDVAVKLLDCYYHLYESSIPVLVEVSTSGCTNSSGFLNMIDYLY